MGTGAGLAGSFPMQRLSPILLIAPLLLAAGCQQAPDNSSGQPGVVANIMDQTLPNVEDAPPPANAITPVEASPKIETPSPPADSSAGPIPAAMQGRWTGAADRCGDRGADLELTVAPDRLLFHESVGTVKTVTQDQDGRAVVEAAFTGEGQSWTRTLALRTSKDGKALTIVNDGAAVTRKRC
ncbi:hypothetical protein U5A82_05335 [Sphingobium sp. CR2-8]|uniref:hypothetical protein n=1 Tax=Sphingobium sp. CR2-8 TaxID=1306534 RepID=UPI002DB9D344|nr:hypothetical protein [Sphingobium sp. CR2-8]MEC3909913.1 hypothetical protein [Sphingobium sp. CR2-8]